VVADGSFVVASKDKKPGSVSGRCAAGGAFASVTPLRSSCNPVSTVFAGDRMGQKQARTLAGYRDFLAARAGESAPPQGSR